MDWRKNNDFGQFSREDQMGNQRLDQEVAGEQKDRVEETKIKPLPKGRGRRKEVGLVRPEE